MDTVHRPPNKKIFFGYKSEILIKYKRIKWTPSRRASHLLPGGLISWLGFLFRLASSKK